MKKEKVYKIFSHIPTLETDRIIMRKMLVKDTDDMFEYAKSEQLTEYLTWYPHTDRDYTEKYLQYISTRYRTGDFYDWALECKADGKMIGTCGFTRIDCPNNSAEAGYVINPDYSGQGIATEVLGKVIEFGFTVLLLHRIECRYIVGNNASRRVMEKNGMLFEGVKREGMLVKGIYRDVGTYSILCDEYFSDNY